MKRFISIPIALALVLPAGAQVDPKVVKQCNEAKDFQGCVKAFTTTPVSAPVEDGLNSLRAAMKQVSARIDAGFSLRESTTAFQPVTDQLALVKEKYPTSLAVVDAEKASQLFGIVQAAWQARINSLSVGVYTGTTYSCAPTERGVRAFNDAVGSEVVQYKVSGGLFGLGPCYESVGTRHEISMLDYISKMLNKGSVSPEEIAAKEALEKEAAAKLKKERELEALGPWNRHLEENPSLKKWVEANPAAAEKAKEKFIKGVPVESTKDQPDIVLTNKEMQERSQREYLTTEGAKLSPLTSTNPVKKTISETDDRWFRIPSIVLRNGDKLERYYAPVLATKVDAQIFEVPILLKITDGTSKGVLQTAVGAARLDCETAKGSLYLFSSIPSNGTVLNKWTNPEIINAKSLTYEAQKKLCR